MRPFLHSSFLILPFFFMSSPFTPPEVDQEIAPPSSVELLWINHRGAVVGTVAAAVALVLVVLGVLVSSRASRLASENLLSSAQDEAGLRAVITAYPRSDAAADAMLLLAASLRESGKMEESDDLYSRFSESFSRHPMADSGALGRAANARVAGKTDLALSAYQQAAAAYPQSYGAPFALFSQARLLAQQGKGEEAKRVIQTLGSSYPSSISAQAAGVGAQIPR